MLGPKAGGFPHIRRQSRKEHQRGQPTRDSKTMHQRLLDTWLADESGYDERVWPQLKTATEQNRPSYRKRFRD
jgi:hypothetical protein